ncbi:hypothetical protein G5V59_13825 [Nocardioides sp. W3-2-3]|uniref:hypothetical protein n=1 Tax=Nocardioides convexus TaxID=2712224 RepID=UPI00241850D3|nr:hypothetical protein [Nocardioides convexus]NHA00724.1 hypothetical protein [Nocardioides convexus]
MSLVRLVRATAGPILELAAGSGRLTLPLLGMRRPLTAVESLAGHGRDPARRGRACPWRRPAWRSSRRT